MWHDFADDISDVIVLSCEIEVVHDLQIKQNVLLRQGWGIYYYIHQPLPHPVVWIEHAHMFLDLFHLEENLLSDYLW